MQADAGASNRRRRPSPSAGYGRPLGESVRADHAAAVVTRSLGGAEVAVTEIRVDEPEGRVSDPLPPEDAYLVCWMIRDNPIYAYFENGRQVSTNTLRARETAIHDIRRGPGSRLCSPLHTLVWYLPRTAIDALADQASVPRIGDLRIDPGAGVFDETIDCLGLSLLPALQDPDCINRLFADYVALALATHTAHAFGGMHAAPRLSQGGLAPWQERRSKEMIGGDLRGATPLAAVAEACGLSASYFTRAFRRSTGLPPHAWLLQVRVERAMTMLRRRDGALAEIAMACGFADQAHFTRAFTRRVGTSPGAWRRARLS